MTPKFGIQVLFAPPTEHAAEEPGPFKQHKGPTLPGRTPHTTHTNPASSNHAAATATATSSSNSNPASI
ncbi:hypothetical protein ACTXJU_17990, partial [Glutamicibacter ardleyensis]|uniref:hypothetical protein n=2 Tax=Glutamicibacter ardleyensis TaxID=225894 RepID=UPI003FD29028